MGLESIVGELREWPIEELRKLPEVIEQELTRRAVVASGPQNVDMCIQQYQDARGREDGSEYEPPITAADAYPLDSTVVVEGEEWVSVVPANPHRPGESGWKLKGRVNPETGRIIPPRFIQPAGAHDAYKAGDLITWEDGTVRKAARDGVVHTPAEYPPDWVLVEAEGEQGEPEPEPEEPEPTDPDEDEPVDPEPEEPPLPGWEVGKAYTAGDQFTYQGTTYRVLQGHTSAAHWPPDQVASLYEVT